MHDPSHILAVERVQGVPKGRTAENEWRFAAVAPLLKFVLKPDR